MIQSISYNLTDKESTLLKVSAKMFEDSYKFESFLESESIRSLIDPGSSEYKLSSLFGFTKAEEVEIQRIWYKLMYIMSAFHNRVDLKAKIHENVAKQTPRYRHYESNVKEALSEYILFLRTGSCYCYDQSCELVENMTIDSLVDLLEEELYLRTRRYRNNYKDVVIVEIATLFYDYDEIKKKYPEEEYIKYITTAAHTKRLINYRQMIASMYAK